MEIINGYKVSYSNGSVRQRCSVTVKNERGQIAAKVYSDSGKMLHRIRKNLLDPDRATLIGQLRQSGVAQETIDAIVSL